MSCCASAIVCSRVVVTHLPPHVLTVLLSGQLDAQRSESEYWLRYIADFYGIAPKVELPFILLVVEFWWH